MKKYHYLMPKKREYLYLIPIPIVFLAAIPFLTKNAYLITLLYLIFINIILAESWNLIGGYGGQISLGIGAFFGVGAYTSVILINAGLTPFLSVPLGGIMAVGLAIVTTPTFKLRGVYFAIGTLFLPEIIKVVVLTWRSVTGGAAGIFMPIQAKFTAIPYYLSSFFLVMFVLLFTHIIANSKVGIALRAIREEEEAAGTLGVNAIKFKFIAYACCAFFVGLSGGIHSFYLLMLFPQSTFYIMWSVGPVFMSIIGGVGTLAGPIVGAIIFTFLSQVLVMVPIIGEIHLFVLGSLLIGIILLMPGGIVGTAKKVLKL